MWTGLPSVSELPTLVWAGLWTGAISAVLAVSMVLTFRVARVINLAVGSIFVVGAFFSARLVEANWPVLLVLVGAGVAGGLVSIAEERIVLAPLRREAPFTQLLATVGVAILVEGVVIVVEGRQPVVGEAVVSGNLTIGPIDVSAAQALLFGLALVAALAGQLWLTKTPSGRATCATSDDADAAMMLGINVPRLRWMIFGATGIAVGVAGYLATPVTLVDYARGLPLSLAAFVAAVLGGGRSPLGAALGGIGIGLVESFGSRIFNANIATVATAVVLVALVLIARRFPSFRALETA